MSNSSIDYFVNLKKDLALKFVEYSPESDIDITNWRQKEINRFQELIQEKINDRISEKWFYTHLKNKNNTKLPRIDTLNLLCRFLEYESWDNYVLKNTEKVKKNIKKSASKRNRQIFSRKALFTSMVAVLVILVVIISKSELLAQQKYSFCFVNAYSGEKLLDTDIEVSIMHENQSDEVLKCRNDGCFEYTTKDDKIKFAIKASYYKTDTIIRYLNKNISNETIKLKPDDYALMIHVFSSSKLEDWEKRRQQLDLMIADNAKIIQLDFHNRTGIELYNKADFIDKLTMPIKSLKNLQIIQTQYDGEKIKLMRFVQAEE